MDLVAKKLSDSMEELSESFRNYFLNSEESAAKEYQSIVSRLAKTISEQVQSQSLPYCGKSPSELSTQLSKVDFFPEEGTDISLVLEKTKEILIGSNISVYHPHCVAHLHCPSLIVSLAAEMIIAAFNQSMDSWDQAPAATMIEKALCQKLCAFSGFGKEADAVFTGGGTMSNFMGLLLARDHYSQEKLNWNIQKDGLPPEARNFRIICANHAHFTVMQSASILGLGQHSVVKLEDKDFEENPEVLEATILSLQSAGLYPICYVSTAGTTDYGSIGNLSALADISHKHGLWFHVDAAFGGALLFSEKQRPRLKGLEKADSVTIDFHKLFFQPISCGAFIVKDEKSFEYLRLHADYLNPEGNETLGIPDLVYKSIQTTRRFDALKPFLAFQQVGLKKFGEMIDYTIELANHTATMIKNDPEFELAVEPSINTVVFRYLPKTLLPEQKINELNDAIKMELLLSGHAVIGQTRLHNNSFLKFTLLNPMTKTTDLESLLGKIKSTGEKLAR